MRIVTADEMREIDRQTTEGYGISGVVLMERAGLAVVRRIKEIYGRKKIVVISGGGSNGGDGLVVARNLHNDGWDVKVFLLTDPGELSSDALSQYEAATRFGLSIRPAEELFTQNPSVLMHHTLIVDAILGTGLSRTVAGKVSKIVRLINDSGLPVVSVDIPSGVSSDNGQIMGDAIRADHTITFGLPKRGHFLHPGARLSGRLYIEDIGFPRELLESGESGTELITKDAVSGIMPVRRDYSNKGDYGRILIVAGSRGKTGAALLAAKACLRAGAGLVTLGIPETLADLFQSRVTEEMVLPLPDRGDGTLSVKASRAILDFIDKPSQTLAIGPGIGVSKDTTKLVKDIIRNSASPIVIDADGINSLMGDRTIFRKAAVPVILTPHPGEMARLLWGAGAGSRFEVKKGPVGKNSMPANISDIEKDRIKTAVSFSQETGTFLVLKGVPTVIATPYGKAFLNPGGNPGMAKAGTGDVLTGMISGFLGQTRDPLHACILGVYLHSLSGDIAASEKGPHSLLATDIIDKIPASFCSFDA
jgi:ADP-dependent NAD(P)H-hydrate dehydratase / NAD(P)H-hydrate epimerase